MSLLSRAVSTPGVTSAIRPRRAISPKRSSRKQYVIVILLLLVPLARVAMTYPVFSQTVDEPYHVAAGVQWWSGRYDLDREHPPLARIAFGALPVLDGATVPASADAVQVANGYFYRDGLAGYTRNVTLARAPNLVFLLVLLVVTFWWTRRLFGDAAALFALAILGALPPVLGHAGLATTDVVVTAMLPVAALAFCRWVVVPSWRRALALGVAVGLGLLAKFSFLLFFPLVALGFVGGNVFTGWRPSRAHANALLSLVVALLCVWGGYRFSMGKLNDLRRDTFKPGMVPRVAAEYASVPGYDWVRPDLVERYRAYGRAGGGDVDFVDWAKASGYPSPLAGRRGDTLRGARPLPAVGLMDRVLEPFRAGAQWVATHVNVPAPEFVVGAEYVAHHSRTGHPSFFLGQRGDRGWWSYFPVVTFFKTPLALVILCALGVLVLLRRRDAEAIGIALAPLAILFPAMTSTINIGVRHVLPLYPFAVMAAAALVVRLWRPAMAGLLVWYFASTTLCHPDYLSYFNEAAGKHPERIAIDSNLDWGQDLLRLASAGRSLQPLYVDYFGSADWPRHLPRAQPLPRGERVHGWVAVSEMSMAFHPELAWLEPYPVRRLGASMRLYAVP
jgi:4-amino-4-deoxy-L-arabinose transferase-like glycosyltransferase